MDNSWQSQCGSMWQSSTPTPTPVSSTQLQLQESLNQMLNAGHHFYPRIVQEPNSSGRGMMLEPSFTCTSNLSSYNSGHAELGNSFLSLLSGPPSLLQCDLQQLPNQKSFITSSKDPVNGSSAAGSGVSPTGLLSHNLDNWNLKTGVDLCPVVSSRAVASAYSGGASCLHDVLQAAHLNIQSSEHAKAVFHHNFNGIEKVKDFSPMRGRGLASPSPSHAGKLHSTSILASQKAPLETNAPVPRQSSPLTSGCPRVFCLGASGDLLLSNTGLLGVVCSCHGLHMSISKFSEHSGLRDVNPGDAVHMDNGETIAQWRKDYFHKFGIRVPEDHSGWNWPEGFSAAAGIASNSSRSSDLSKLGGPSGSLVASGQQWNNNVISKNPHTSQKFVNGILHSEKPRTAQHSWNFFNSFCGTSQSHVHAVADNQIMDCPMSGCATVSKIVGLRGSDNGSQSISTYIDSISKSGSSFIPLPHLQNLKTSCKDSDVVRFNNLKVGDTVDRATVSSNIELRLGQPSQQSQTLGNSIVPAFGSHVIGTHDHHPQKSLPLEPLNPNRNYRAMEEGRQQYLQCAAGTPKSSTRREQRQFNIVNHSSGVYSAMDAAQTEQFRGDAAMGSVISTLFSHLKRPAEGKMQPKATNNMVDGSHVIPGKLHCKSHILKYDPNNFLQNRGNGTETQFNVKELEVHKQMDIGKGVGFAADGAHVATESNFGFHTNYKGSLSSSNGVIGETGRYTCSVVRNKSSQSYQLSEMPINASDTRNPFNCVGKNSCLGRNGHLDHGFLRSVNFPMDSAPIFPSKAVSKEFSSTTSVSVPNLTPTLSTNREGIDVSPYLLNENLRMLALRNMLELSNQDHAISSFGTTQEQRGFKNSHLDKIECCIAGPSTSTERSLGFDLSSKQDASEVVMKSLKSGVTHWMSGDVEKLAPVADIEMQCQLSHDPHPNEQPLLRLGRSENDITPSNEHGKCCQQVPYAYFQGKCSCAVHTNYSGENCDFKGKNSLSAFQEQAGSVGGRASMLFPSNLDGNCTFPKDKAISIGQSGLLQMQNSKKVKCHTFQWRDVPNKVTGICNVTCKDRPADLMDGRGSVEDQIAAAAAKCFNRSAQGAESLKEKELSNISSGCSAPAITQASVKANNGDSCTVDVRDSRRASNLVVDEGSGIDKCWSSDDALDSERSTEFGGFACKINSINKGSSKPFPNQSSRSLIDELRLRDSLRSKKTPNQIHTGFSNKEKTNHMQKIEGGFKTGKRKKATKWKMLDASFPTSGVSSGHNESPRCTSSAEQHSHSSKDVQMLLRPDQGRSHNCACSAEPSFKRRRSEMSSYKTISHKRNLRRLYDNREGEVDFQTQLSVDDNCLELSETSHGKRFRSDRAAPTVEQVWKQEPNCSDDEITVKCNSVDCTRTSIQKVNVCKRKAKPVVCGKYGIISNGDTSKPAKILSIRKILKTARKCTLAENDKLKLTKAKELKNIRNRENNGCSSKFTNYKEERPREGQDGATYGEVDPDDYVEKTAMVCFPEGKGHDDVSYMLEKERYDRCEKDHSIPDGCPSNGLKSKIKDVRKRSLNELTIKGKDSCCANFFSMKNSNCVPRTKSSYLGKFLENAESSKSHASEVYDANKSTDYKLQSMSDLDAFCCVCGGSNKDEINCLLECNRCLIKVHQACYGVSKVPKAHWYCRPCRTSSKNIVCVLCGYGGGAMTRALQSHNIVKNLLKYWNFETAFVPKNPTSPTESLEDQLNVMPSPLSGPESDSLPVIGPVSKMDLQKHLDSSVKDSSYAPSNSMVHNSITAGVRDSTIKQWVHMVCGLWTPGTRCPNVDTMSAFDVSGASHPKVHVVCSICNRPGGSCIQCRVVDCSVQFHPWCARQKGLLQSEVEGIDNENVGFYGRCELHATQHHCNSVSVPCDTGTGHPGEKETCARTEGYKGRKREGFQHNIPRQSDGSSGCLVPQDQLNAWLHINGLKSCTKGPPKLPTSDVEYDCRKEYTRYKQSKGWKHLVVYKSGIHALGLYTSRFISRGAMVVEYVGEIVGLRVADKREIEYQSGRKLQYKSACYFFRIDKEHIIDATCKGGIARFVNHSCLPNCVAKIISVRNEKKVVFFAERDIYPGEEITYDYHFNNEDEGKKIPCFCNSKNCRRYLN